MRWPDGTLMSQDNAFSWQTPETLAKRDAEERERAYWRETYQRRKEREIKRVAAEKAAFRAQREAMKKAATRVNKSVDLGSHGGVANALKGR